MLTPLPVPNISGKHKQSKKTCLYTIFDKFSIANRVQLLNRIDFRERPENSNNQNLLDLMIQGESPSSLYF